MEVEAIVVPFVNQGEELPVVIGSSSVWSSMTMSPAVVVILTFVMASRVCGPR